MRDPTPLDSRHQIREPQIGNVGHPVGTYIWAPSDPFDYREDGPTISSPLGEEHYFIMIDNVSRVIKILPSGRTEMFS